ncbi:hypothetical protein M877_28895 [Streptomyces niveus NCIMB 11891]|nr:hypothetical protein M877_28895 [Streptomyces niveus NCIMB 11891]
MSENDIVAVFIVCVTAIIVARIWASTKRKYPR